MPIDKAQTERFFREKDKEVARADADKAKRAVVQKTAKLKALRLAKEAEDAAAKATDAKPKKKRATAKRIAVPAHRRG